MKKLLLVALLFFSFNFVKAQVASISPSNAFRGQTLTTTITMANGVMFSSSSSLGTNDIYLQQGATTIFTSFYTWPMSVPPYYDDVFTADFTIPVGAPFGWYDVHVITYDYSQPWLGVIPVDNILTNGFLVPQVNSCPVPTGVSVSAITNTTATVNWITPTVADTFRIRYKTATSGYFYKDVNGSGGLTSTSLSNLSPGETYDVDISTICNGAISSTYSVPVVSFTTGTTVVPCIRPYGISASGVTNTAATILWTNYVSADTFRIRYAEQNTINYRYINSTSPIPHTASLTNLNPGTTYTVQISSICLGVSSGYSAPFNFTTLSTPINCARPYAVAAGSITNVSANISWTNFVVADTFRIRYSEFGSGNNRYINVNGALAHNYTLTNLAPATTYNVQISSICNGVSSGYCPVYQFVTLSTPVACARPWGLSSSNTTNTSVTLSWSPYVTADTFRIRYSKFGSGINQYMNINGAGGSTVTLNNLQPNSLYSYQVSSICSGVSSGYSASDNFTTLNIPVACSRPHSLSVSNITNVSALIDWTNLVTADTFRIRYNVQGSFSFIYLNQPGSSGYSAIINGLYPNTTYNLAISSICSGVSTGYSSTITFTTSAVPIACVIPTGLATSNITNNSADVSWTQYVSADTFLIRYSVNGTTNYLWKKVPGTGGNGTTLTGLAANTTYQWQVRSVCIASPQSSYSAPLVFGTPLRTRKPDVTENSFVVYPNPATDKVSISIERILEEEQHSLISIYDLSGRLILEKEINIVSGKNLFELDVEFLSSGMYLLKVGDEKILLNKN